MPKHAQSHHSAASTQNVYQHISNEVETDICFGELASKEVTDAVVLSSYSHLPDLKMQVQSVCTMFSLFSEITLRTHCL